MRCKMGKLKYNKNPFGAKKRRLRRKSSKQFDNERIEFLKSYNLKKVSWFDQINEDLDELTSASARKIRLPEEDIDFEDESDGETDNEYYEQNEEENEEHLTDPDRFIIMDISLLQAFLDNNLVCKNCNQTVQLYENELSRQGFATKLVAKCSPECISYTNSTFETSK